MSRSPKPPDQAEPTVAARAETGSTAMPQAAAPLAAPPSPEVLASPAAPAAPRIATLLVSCRDRTGLVAALSDFVFRHAGNIVDADQHADRESGQFFMRLVWDLQAFSLDRGQLQAAMEELARKFEMTWELTFSDVRPRVAVFTSKSPHCLYDLLFCQQLGELGGEIAM